MTIWKFNLPREDHFSLSVPKGARVLSFHEQNNELYIWMLIPKEPTSTGYPIVDSEQYEMRSFCLVTTGKLLPDDFVGRFIGTAVLDSGAHVEHLFEMPRS